ncbi:aminotransferase class IV-domain-containing protein [Mycena alexandri]|uniref:Aminotransferase class IV-domain-containing protein n=1 Tax=Mycena alexandri TaxID=1745969 RepID=A0AAD6XCL9_9AGAR|nr:aminotransferase class IV-domain-containing protein [Mycena alexandri]
MSESFDLLTTTRWDPYLDRLAWNNYDKQPSRFLLLAFHLDRLQQAAAAHEWPAAVAALSYPALHEKCQAAVASYDAVNAPEALRIRITLSRAGLLTVTAFPIPPFKSDPTSPSFFKPLTDSATLYGPALALFADTQPMPPPNLFTSTKTTERTLYNAARTRVGLSPTSTDAHADVLLYNPADQITESSVANVAFYHVDTWVTPPLASGCLPGVLRRWLLQHKRIREAEPHELATKAALRPGHWVLLFNSLYGCRLGRIADASSP